MQLTLLGCNLNPAVLTVPSLGDQIPRERHTSSIRLNFIWLPTKKAITGFRIIINQIGNIQVILNGYRSVFPTSRISQGQ